MAVSAPSAKTDGVVGYFTGVLRIDSGRGAAGWPNCAESREAATLLSTLAIAGEIILISRFAGQVDVRRVTFIQLTVASLCAFCFMIPNGESVPALSTPLLVSAVGLGAASALIQVTMNWAQRSVSPTRATVIYAGEPVWAGVVGRLAGERLPAAAILGGILIVCGVIVSELRWKRSMPSASSDE